MTKDRAVPVCPVPGMGCKPRHPFLGAEAELHGGLEAAGSTHAATGGHTVSHQETG